MNKTLLVARGTFKDLLRKKIMHLIFLAALLTLAATNIITFFDESIQVRLLKDLAFSVLTFFGVILGMVICVDILPNELQSRSIYHLLSRPLKRWQYVCGKFLGSLSLVSINIILVGICFCVTLYFRKGIIPSNTIPGIWFILLKSCVMGGITLALSFVMSKASAISMSVLIYIGGDYRSLIEYYLSKAPNHIVDAISKPFMLIVPRLDLMTTGDAMIHGIELPGKYTFLVTLYAIGYLVTLAGISSMIFSRKDL
ncbi:MAG: hypothetical protein CVV64_05505 [Candidatus Wallbacteria bacterium HGW-Wallbacteria-1]|jgi:ABC-type transport system involved in multi-copper enzyme maturation permease subunit|uniref:ABC transporter permease n=1 Tax=Candidatus Wallbacteria bacterium HGW-Wallbacteria-1 TaxID=2013854 RepID=A0A2N1PSB7_9BACT|nr:MAG: hypothetical protein CVV64_05505 [Candidatus Wallbacteria bacterium HGW-Wallbacteria-1]